MTTFQDPQPQSRRAVRQGERGDAETPAGSFPAQPPAPAAPQYFSDPDAQRDMWDTNARRAAQLPATPAPRPDAAVTGRRAAANASPPPAAAEPLNYSTGARPSPAPSYDPQSFRTRLDARQAQQAATNPPAAATPPRADDQAFRVRDFSPEGRRAAQAAERAAAVPAWTPTAPATDLDYQTEVREGFGMPQAPVTPAAPISQVPPQYAAPQAPPQYAAAPQPYVAPVAPASTAAPVAPTQQPVEAPMSDAPGEQTLSRRELRALLAQQEAAAGAQPFDPSGEAPHHAPVAWQTPAPVAPAAQVPIQSAQQAPLYEPAAAQAAPSQVQQPAPLQPPAQVQQQAPLQAPQPYEATRLPEVATPVAAPQPSTNTAMTSALAEFDARANAQVAPVAEEPAGWRPPVGHWSTQGDLEDDALESAINRRVGSGSTATNALVLPEIPLGSDIRGPLTSTGEVMLTGSIDLPHSLSSTGSSGRMEHEGIDSLFDLSDHEVISTDSQPVRAIKAVSTHQTGHGVTHTQKPKGTRALTVLLISASSMAVVVAGLLVAAFAFNIF